MSNLGYFKPSIIIEELLSEDLREDSQNFLQFLTAYYEWLQTTNITYEFQNESFPSNVTEKTFNKDEIIVGTSTLAQAKIDQLDTANNQLIVTMLTNKQFNNEEIFAQSIPEVRFDITASSNVISYSEIYANTVISSISIGDEIRIGGENHIVDNINSTAIIIESDHVAGARTAHIVKLGPYVNVSSIVDVTTKRGIIKDISDNVIRKSGRLLEYRDPEKTIDKYVNFLKQELYDTFPKGSVADERTIARRLRDFYKSKGNDESYRFLFRMLFGEEIELKYPGEDLLRISDGKFEQTNTLRVEVTENIFSFLNKTIAGATSGALGTVVEIRKIIISETEVAQMELGLVVGTFAAGEQIYDVADSSLSANLYGIISGFTIHDGGSGYDVGDNIVLTGDGSAASAKVSSIRKSPIYKLKINDIGYGYRNNLFASINNTGTGGDGLIVAVESIANTYVIEEPAGTYYEVGQIDKISILNRGRNYAKKPVITLIDPIIEPLGMLHQRLIVIDDGGSGYSIGDGLNFIGSNTATAIGSVASVAGSNNILLEDATNIIFDNALDRILYGFESIENETLIFYENEQDILKEEGTLSTGAILRIELTDYGRGYDYLNLPTVTITSSGGADASLTVTGIQGRSADIEVDTANVESRYGVGSIRDVEIIDFGLDYSTATVDMTGSGDGNANLIPIIVGSGTSRGFWKNDDGKIDYKVIQDSEYWQDFSYVIRSGLVIERYASIVKEILHPAGTVFFGEILIYNEINVTPTFTGIVDVVGAIQNYFIYIRSLADVHIDSDPQKIEKEIPLATNVLDELLMEDGYKLVHQDLSSILLEGYFFETNNTNIDPVVIIEKPIDLTGDEHTEYIVNIERPIDIHIDSDPQKIEKEIPLEALNPAPLTNDTNIDPVVIIEKHIDLTGDEHSQKIEKEYELPIDVHITSNKEYEIILERDVDVSTLNDKEYIIKFAIEGFAGDLAPHSQKVEKEYELPIDVHITSNKEYLIYYQTEANTAINSDPQKIEKEIPSIGTKFDNSVGISESIEKEYHLLVDVVPDNITEYIVQQELDGANAAVGAPAGPITSTYGEQQIIVFALSPISSLQDITFDTEYLTTVDVWSKITGTVNVSSNVVFGTGTTFLSDFIEDTPIVIDNTEKFVVKSVANNVYMELNVPSQSSYTDVYAYR
jgi:hypothetical protein